MQRTPSEDDRLQNAIIKAYMLALERLRMSEIEDDDGKPVTTGTILASPKSQYVLEELLGEGGFGAVYRVHLSTDNNQQFAMKLEKKLAKRRHSKLKMEIYILKLLMNEQKNRGHFTAIVDRGKKQNFFFLVMQLVGKSLEDLHRDRPTRCFSLATSFGVGIQSLEALEDLHKVGFLHRDLKPANYACGTGEKTRLIYLLDFGIARKYVNTEKEIKVPRCMVTFKGTVRYASMNCHRNQELGPKDDCESWFYMIVELMWPKGLPWRKLSDRSTVLRSKEESRKNRENFLPKLECREELGLLLDYIDKQCYADQMDYEYFYQLLRLCAEIEKVDIDQPFDWERTTSTSIVHSKPSTTPRTDGPAPDAKQQPSSIKQSPVVVQQADSKVEKAQPDSGGSSSNRRRK